MMGDILDFFKTELSVGNLWQNIAMYSTLALLTLIIAVQHKVLKERNTNEK